MGMFYLLTLYGFIRYATTPAADRGAIGPLPPGAAPAAVGAKASRRAWWGFSVGCCLLGMATKEVMATAPVMLLLYDRTFLAGSWREAWRRRWGIYVALAATWLPLALFVASTGGNRGGSVGFGIAVKWWAYGLTQFEAVTRYLGLAIWPHPLVFEYGMFWVTAAGQVLPFVLPVLLLLGVTIWFLLSPTTRTRRTLGFLGAWFFGILAPSSLMPGTTQMIVEHRMYLPLAALMAFLVLGIDAILIMAWQRVGTSGSRPAGTGSPPQIGTGSPPQIGTGGQLQVGTGGQPQVGTGGPPVRVPPEASPEPPAARAAHACLLLCVALAVGFGVLTHRRNETYRSSLALWGDTVAKRPGNVVARFNLGTALFQLRQIAAAMDQFERAVRLRPDLAATHYNLASELSQVGQPAAAVAEYAEALRIDPGYAEAQDGWGIALALLGRPAEAITHYQEALRLRPDYAQAHDNLGNALLQLDRGPKAAAEYAEAVRIDPSSALAQTNLGSELLQLGRAPEAIPHLIEAVERDPSLAEAHAKLGDAWMESERPADAIRQYEAALSLNPNYVQAQNNLGIALAATGRLPEAVEHYEAALRLEPDLADAHYNLANTLFRLGRPADAAAQYEAVLRLRPDDSGARTRLDLARQAAARGSRP